MAKKTKGPSLARTAKVYKKNTKPSNQIMDTASGKRITKSDGRIPTASEPRVPNVKLKAKDVTLGGTRKNKGATVKRIGRA